MPVPLLLLKGNYEKFPLSTGSISSPWINYGECCLLGLINQFIIILLGHFVRNWIVSLPLHTHFTIFEVNYWGEDGMGIFWLRVCRQWPSQTDPMELTFILDSLCDSYCNGEANVDIENNALCFAEHWLWGWYILGHHCQEAIIAINQNPPCMPQLPEIFMKHEFPD